MVHHNRNLSGGAGWLAARRRRLVVAGWAAVAVAGNLQAGDLVPPPGLQGYFADEGNSAQFESLALHYLNELSARRRITTLFPNEQSPFYGVQLNYVNAREGNLTFLMRDMVRGAQIPIVFGRIYDSRKQDESDFGRGWKLSVAESLELGENGVVYTDASNSRYLLQTDGSRIWSEHPHLTGILEGSVRANEVTIQSGSFTKVFRRRGGVYRFVEIRDRTDGWLRFNYAEDLVTRIHSSSGRFVDILRDQAGKIIGARDDSGRVTRYSYDAAGALVESFDVGGGVTQYGYDAHGFLSNVIDSRGLESIAAQFRDDGKVAAVDSQHDKTTYEYGAAGTTVRNASQQAAVITYHASGLVESATDFAGGVTMLEFDQSLRVQRLSFNGAAVALAEYQNARLSVLSRVDSYHSHEPQSFYYDSRGRLTRVEEGDGVVARYAYDDFDRVTYAFDSTTGYSGSYGSHGHSASGYSTPADAGALRRYRFDARGDLSGVSMNDMTFRFRTNRFGMIEHVAWAENSAIDITYADTDRVRALRYDVDNVTFGSEFEYDDGGFRVSGRYDVLRSLGDTDVAFDYDSTGNLIRLEMPGPEGTRRVMRHTIGSENQLLLLTPVGNEVFEQAIEYDRSGRAVRSVQGDREAAFAYDELGRLTDVYLDREHVLTASHGPMDVDPVHAADDYSASTPTGEPVASAVFGSLDEIVYTRAFGTPYGIVRFIPEMARFIIPEHPVVPRDSVLLASLRRRNLASEGTLNPSPLLGFDKPSSSLFVPPEFFTSNCAGCAGGTTGFDIDRVGSGEIETGQTITFQASATPYLSVCIYWYMSGYDVVQIPHLFVHNVSFLGGGGSGGGAYYTGTPDTQFSGSYSTPGAKTVQDTLTCSCGGIFMAQAQRNINVCQAPIPQIIGEYTTHGVNLAPVCDDFTQTRSSTHFAFSEILDGAYTWALIRDPLVAPAASGYGLDKWRDEYGAALNMNSGYRSPAYNLSVGGATQSRHMYGDAGDIDVVSNQQAEWILIRDAALNADPDFVEPINGPCGTGCVHADWRNHTGDYRP